MSGWYCQKCGKEVPGKACECGSEDIFAGAVWNEKEKSFKCECGRTTGIGVMHMDGDDFYRNIYECDCGNCIMVQNKRTDGWF